MKTLAKLLYVEADEEITDLVDRLRDLSQEDEVTFVVPERARSLSSAMSFRLLKRYADSYGKRVNVVSADPRLQAMSQETGFTAYPNLAAYDRGTGVQEPELTDQPYVPAPSSHPAFPAATSVGAASAAAAAPNVRTGPATPPGPSTATAPTGPTSLATPAPARQSQVMSAPPKKKTPSPSLLSEGPPLRSYRPYLIGAGVLAVIVLLVGILYLPSATATLTVQGTPIKADFTLRGAPGTAAGAADQFVTQPIHAEESQTLPGTATGQKQIPAQAAAGSVTFTENCSNLCITGTLHIAAGTKVSTSDGKEYATQKAVSVPSPHGSGSVGVTATQPGPNGNTDAHTITTINNSPDDSLSVANSASVSGGADARTATVIQQSDIDTVRDGYLKDATTRVTDQINGKAGGLHVVLVGTGVTSTVTTDHKVGDEVSGLGITVKVVGDAVAFDEKAVKAMLKADLQHKIPQGTQLTSNSAPTYDPIDTTADGHVTLNGHVSGFYTPVFLESAIRAHLKGMSPSKAHAFLQSLPSVLDARVVQQPFGLPWLPLFSSRISLQIQEVSGASSP